MTDDDTELATLLEAERAEFAEMFRLTAKARALEAEHDHSLPQCRRQPAEDRRDDG